MKLITKHCYKCERETTFLWYPFQTKFECSVCAINDLTAPYVRKCDVDETPVPKEEKRMFKREYDNGEEARDAMYALDKLRLDYAVKKETVFVKTDNIKYPKITWIIEVSGE